MSEYQSIHFAAVDRPLDDKQLAFMRRQSTRAKVSRWQFTNEYHFGDFHGDAKQMMRRGYDVHLHYANFGVRRLMFRLPALPWPKDVFDAYAMIEGVDWAPDRRDEAGTLCFDPEADAGIYAEGFWELEEMAAALPGVRRRLIAGDLRPLYLLWLACEGDEAAVEPPVPAGLGALPAELELLGRFYELSPDLLAAAAEPSPGSPPQHDQQKQVRAWIDRRSAEELRAFTARVLTGDEAAARAEALAQARQEAGGADWPVAEAGRTLGALRETAQGLQKSRQRRERAAEERARKKRLAALAADPQQAITRAKQRVKGRTIDDYQQAAAELAELREALGPQRGEREARAAAEALVRAHPTRHHLKAALRNKGLLDPKKPRTT